jgi:hypothetical protein
MKTGTFLVTSVDDEAATLREVHDGQVVTLTDGAVPDDAVVDSDADAGRLEVDEVLAATVAPEPPLEVAYQLHEVESRRTIPVEESSESPTTMAQEIAAGQAEGEVTRRERAGEGEIHVLTVPPERTESAVADVIDDEETVARAARLGVNRVSIRAADGVVSVRYLP